MAGIMLNRETADAETIVAPPKDMVTEDGIHFRVADEAARTVEVTKYTGTSAHITIPSTYVVEDKLVDVTTGIEEIISRLEFDVVGIAENAFYDCDVLETVRIPSSVTYIDKLAFSHCDFLTDVMISEGSQSLSIGNDVFNQCSSLASITIPGNATCVGDCAFLECSSLTNVVISKGSQPLNIGNSAFFHCEKLTDITLPGRVTCIGSYAFSHCSSLANVTISENAHLKSIGENAFAWCYDLTSFAIPKGVESIGDYAFHNCRNLRAVTISDSVTSIGNHAFDVSCLESIVIPKSVVSIGEGAFLTLELKEILVDEGNPQYLSDNGVLYNREKTTLVQYPAKKATLGFTIPESVTYIGDYAFYEYNAAGRITIPENVTTIGRYAFESCSMDTLTIPKSVVDIGEGAFARGSWPLGLLVDEDNPCYISENGFLYDKAKTILICGPYGPLRYQNSVFTIPESVTEIGEYAFSYFNDYNSETTIIIPEGVVKIRQGAFSDCCTSRISVPESVIEIDDFGFQFPVMSSSCIYCKEGSYIESYAKEKGILYKIGKIEQTVTASDITCTYGDGPLTVGAETAGDGVLSYESSDDTIAAVSPDGTLSVTGVGTAQITITASETDACSPAQKGIQITVNPRPEDIPNIQIDYGRESLEGFESQGEYTIDGKTVSPVSGKLAVEESMFGKVLSIIRKGNGGTTVDSPPLELRIPLRPGEPEGLVSHFSASNETGKISGVSTEMEYRKSGVESWTACTGSEIEGLTEGSYQVRAKASGTAFAGRAAEVHVQKEAHTVNPSPAEIPHIQIDYKRETLEGFETRGEYSVDGKTVSPVSGKLAIEESMLGKVLSIVRKGNGATTADSAPLELRIPARPKEPEGLVSHFPAKNKTGKITGASPEMEYRKSGGAFWIACIDNEIQDLTEGSYQVRTRASGTAFASRTAEVTVRKDALPVKLSVSSDFQSVAAGKKAVLKLRVSPGTAKIPAVKWKSSSTKYASVNEKGVVRTTKKGAGKTVTIWAVATDGSGLKASVRLKVMKHAVTKVQFKNPPRTLKANKSLSLRTIIRTNGKSANKKLKWSTSHPKYMTVNSKGRVTAKKAGKGKIVTITAISTDGTNKKASAKIKIK